MINLQKLITQPSWHKELAEEWDKPYIKELETFLNHAKNTLPAQNEWFKAINSQPFDQVKVIILGQDPYPTVGHAHGLSFSVQEGVKPLPKSLLNINKELFSDLGINNQHTGDLQYWNQQGVLLLNTVLTVEAGKANSHQGKGWEVITDKIIKQISKKQPHCVFILWGASSQKKSVLIDVNKHLIIESAHPSPLSAYRGFWDSKPFSKTNQFLVKNKLTAIDWKLANSQPSLFEN